METYASRPSASSVGGNSTSSNCSKSDSNVACTRLLDRARRSSSRSKVPRRARIRACLPIRREGPDRDRSFTPIHRRRRSARQPLSRVGSCVDRPPALTPGCCLRPTAAILLSAWRDVRCPTSAGAASPGGSSGVTAATRSLVLARTDSLRQQPQSVALRLRRLLAARSRRKRERMPGGQGIEVAPQHPSLRKGGWR